MKSWVCFLSRRGLVLRGLHRYEVEQIAAGNAGWPVQFRFAVHIVWSRVPELWSLDRMKTHIISLLAASLLICGCDHQTAEERLNAANLQPYTNIPPGTLVLVQMRADITDYTYTNTLGQPRQYDMAIGSEYIFEGI